MKKTYAIFLLMLLAHCVFGAGATVSTVGGVAYDLTTYNSTNNSATYTNLTATGGIIITNTLGDSNVMTSTSMILKGHAGGVTDLETNSVSTATFYGNASGESNFQNSVYSVSANAGVMIDATTRYQTFITNASYTITGFSGLAAGQQQVFSQIVSNSSSSAITITGSPSTHYAFGSTNSMSVPAAGEEMMSFWINVRTNALNYLIQ